MQSALAEEGVSEDKRRLNKRAAAEQKPSDAEISSIGTALNFN